jgi:hypothetical protein
VGHGFQVSGIYFYGSGQRDQILLRLRRTRPADLEHRRLRGAGDTHGPVGSIIPRNSFVGDPIHRVELRLLQRIPARGQGQPGGQPRGVQPVQPERTTVRTI